MHRILCFISMVIAAAFLTSCDGGGKEEAQVPPLPQPAIGQSEDGSFLTMQKSTLGQEFLLQSSIAYQRGEGDHISNVTSESLKSRIVFFEEHNGELLMLESEKGMQPGDEMPAHTLLATFPIIAADDAMITFDFDAGMRNVLISWDWFVSDFDGNVIYPEIVLTVDNSYLRQIIVDPAAATVIQTLSLKDSMFSVFTPAEVTYYLSLYQENPDFVPVESPGFAYLGFFEINPVVQEDYGVPFTYISKWDVSKPVTYYISQAVPEEYRDAAKEGVLYWNRAFGKKVLNVEMAPDGVTAPNFTHNLVQWHTDNETGAYADAAMNPRTGEILHAQVFISSHFAQWARYMVMQKYRNESKAKGTDDGKDDGGAAEKDSKDLRLSAKQLEEARLCSMSLSDALKGLDVYRDVIQTLSPERIEAVAKDVVREIVAHEVGHTLGLRHNFAASTVNEWSGNEEAAIFGNYLTKGTLPDSIKPPVNSVMDYTPVGISAIVGAMIGKKDAPALEYDAYALNWGYSGEGTKPEYEGFNFCTDSNLYMFDDCRKFDSGAHFVERLVSEINTNINSIPRFIYEAYAAAKAEFNPKFRRPIEQSTPYASNIAYRAVLPWFDLVSLLSRDVYLVSILLKHPDITEVEEEKIARENAKWFETELKRAGGIKSMLGLLSPDDFKKATGQFSSKFNQILSSDSFMRIPLPEGGEATFTEEEIAYMKKRAAELFPEITRQLASLITGELQSASFKPVKGIEEAEPVVAKWAEYIITEGQGLDFAYSYDTRLSAVSALKSSGPYPDWLRRYIPSIAEKLRAKLEAMLGGPIEDVDVGSFPREEQQRIMDEISLYEMLVLYGPPDGGGPVPMPGGGVVVEHKQGG